MKRYYLCDIIGDGGEDNPYRPAVADHGVNYAPVYPSQDPVTGQYARPHCLVLVAAPSHTALRGDARIDPLPDFPLDGKVQAIETASRQRAEQALARRGFQSSHFALKDGYREVVRSVGRELQPGFSEDNLDVSE